MGKKIMKLFLAMFLCFTSITGNVVAETENNDPVSCNLYYAKDGTDGIEVQCPSGVLDSYRSIMVTYYKEGAPDYLFTFHNDEENLVIGGGVYDNGKMFAIDKENLANRLGDIPADEYTVYLLVWKGTDTESTYVKLNFSIFTVTLHQRNYQLM